MDPVRNPFAPGAGSQPPELAGRDDIINDAKIALKRTLIGRHARSQMLLGLRGTGKTVLLNAIENQAEEEGYLASVVEAPEDKPLADLLYPRMQQVLRKLSLVENAKSTAYEALKALRSFAGAFKVQMGDFSVSVDPEPGVADSGNLEYDLTDIFVAIGHAAKAAGKGWCLLIDEVQYLKEEELAALIVAIHKIGQKQLPVIFLGAGLPQLAGLSGDAKSYAERLFSYPKVGALDKDAASKAILGPIEDENEEISETALDQILQITEGYPYFLQEWGFQAWNTADESPIAASDIDQATVAALKRLDDGFFQVRFDRLTPKEREYVIAMAELGKGPYRSSEVAEKLGEAPNKLGPRRAQIIAKGMIYSPQYGDIDFTVPMFDDYLRRNWELTDE
ncbi:ATP-binding protein [Cognatishimia maritima]|uniref:AAA ATPase domain-containing protein n=1 Tax=Cognatishimia maritima TaxID=870908 RepID=A0A1M5KJH1_9RHOB|nr:ATP-binding protein [Cognatishimia maritima]SHG52323.1 AAA ATPase domain-containing protein [Cognatishimia maritima]